MPPRSQCIYYLLWINNAVSLLSKRTTTVLKKYFSPKASVTSEMTSSLPVTPLPVGKRGMMANDQLTSSTPMPLLRSETFVCEDEEQSDRITLENTRLSTFGRTMDLDSPNDTKVLVKGTPSTDSTQIMRPTQSTPKTILRTFCSMDTTHEMTVSTKNNATHTVNSSLIMGRTMSLVPAKDSTRTISGNHTKVGDITKTIQGVGNITQTLEGVGNITKTLEGAGNLTSSVDKEVSIGKTFEVAANCTQTYRRGVNLTKTIDDKTGDVSRIMEKGRNTTKIIEGGQNVTKTIDAGFNLTKSIDRGTLATREAYLSKSIINEPGDYTKVIHQGANLTLSMDQLPLLEHISMPSGLDVLSSRGSSNVGNMDQEADDTLDVTLVSLARDKTNMKLPLNSTLNTERLLDLSGLQSPRHIQLLNLTQELERGTPSRGHLQTGRRSIPQHSLLCLSPQSATTTPHGMRMMGHATPQPVHLLSPLD